MKRLKKFLSASKLNVAVFVLAASLVLAATIGAASATIVYLAETYSSGVEMADIGVTLVENGNAISHRDYTGRGDDWVEETGALLTNMLAETNGELKLHHAYTEELSVCNSGTIGEYVRVVIYTYWEDANGKKLTTWKENVGEGEDGKELHYNPSYINVNYLTGNGWIEDVNARTAERTVLYYQHVLEAGKTTPKFTDTLTISSSLAGIFDENRNYIYDGARFVVKAEVDAIQAHNAEDAIRNAWGINMSDFGIQGS